MIARNLGNIERIIRLLLGVLFAGWAVLQESMTAVDWFVVAVSIALIFNGIFSRCYLWYVLDLNTCASHWDDCPPESTCP